MSDIIEFFVLLGYRFGSYLCPPKDDWLERNGLVAIWERGIVPPSITED